MDSVKIYGLCLERLRHQIKNARQRFEEKESGYSAQVILECYNTGDLDDIIDILELYDVKERTFEGVKEKLDDLAFTVSELIRETLLFDFTANGDLGLYLALKDESPYEGACDTLAASSRL